ncbi:MAG: hemerythrin domain-containing protein [Pseudomonadota bacterium]|nr:hemerythrin domain-containing protein [Pseudomonadota bacterium]
MSTLEWSPDLSLDLPVMDDTHREFVDLLAAVEQTSDAQLMTAWRELIAHTDTHFAREDRWMRDTRFATSNCHSMQHATVMQVIREGERLDRSDIIRQMARELALWFPEHAKNMDAALAQHLKTVGYDVDSGNVALPESLPASVIQGCGSAACTPSTEAPETSSA